jgi:hypothetical protein
VLTPDIIGVASRRAVRSDDNVVSGTRGGIVLMKTKVIAAFGVSFAITAITCYASESQAFWTRQDQTYCQSYGVAYSETKNFLTTNSLVLECPVNDSDTHPKTSINTFNVHVDAEGASNVIAYRCVDFWNAVGGTCGNTVSSSGHGVQPISPPNFSGWSGGDFGEIVVLIPPKSASGGVSSLKGYFTSN